MTAFSTLEPCRTVLFDSLSGEPRDIRPWLFRKSSAYRKLSTSWCVYKMARAGGYDFLSRIEAFMEALLNGPFEFPAGPFKTQEVARTKLFKEK